MRRYPTIAENRWSGPPQEFLELARRWIPDASERLLSYVWEGLDILSREVIQPINITGDEEELERSITELLEPRIRSVVPVYSPFYIQHAARENETREIPPAQAPEYDLAFRPRSNPRIMWPIEAKVIHTDGRVSKYVKEIHDNFLTCRYAPFSSEAVMLAYLVKGSPDKFFVNISKKIPCKLDNHPHFIDRYHRVSDHARNVPDGENYPASITLHHLVLLLS